jgi:hypothetical protein
MNQWKYLHKINIAVVHAPPARASKNINHISYHRTSVQYPKQDGGGRGNTVFWYLPAS